MFVKFIAKHVLIVYANIAIENPHRTPNRQLQSKKKCLRKNGRGSEVDEYSSTQAVLKFHDTWLSTNSSIPMRDLCAHFTRTRQCMARGLDSEEKILNAIIGKPSQQTAINDCPACMSCLWKEEI